MHKGLFAEQREKSAKKISALTKDEAKQQGRNDVLAAGVTALEQATLALNRGQTTLASRAST